MIHPTAIIEEGAILGQDCEIHAYAIVRKYAILGDRVTVHPFAVVGGDPQDLKFNPVVPTYARVGSGTTVREGVTVNRSTSEGEATVVGENCLLMAECHVAHDCILGNRVILANAVLLAGHVMVEDFAILGGNAVVHQFCRIGEGSILSGSSRITRDVAPFTMAAERDEVIGLNSVGLKRRGISRSTVMEIKDAFSAVYLEGRNPRDAAKALLETGAKSPEVLRFLKFFGAGKRGFVPARRGTSAENGGEE